MKAFYDICFTTNVQYLFLGMETLFSMKEWMHQIKAFIIS